VIQSRAGGLIMELPPTSRQYDVLTQSNLNTKPEI